LLSKLDRIDAMNPAPSKYSVNYAYFFKNRRDCMIKTDFKKVELKEGAG